MALRLTDTERANIRAALLAMGPERRARLEGQCFSSYRNGVYCNPGHYCVVGQAIGNPNYESPYPNIAADLLGIATMDARTRRETPEYRGLRYIIATNDAGQLRTRAAVAELLALAE